MGHIVIPYLQRLGESIKKICSKYGIQTYFKGDSTIKEMLIKCIDKDPMDKEPSTCISVMCNEEYIGETSRTFAERYKEYLKEPSPIHAHRAQTGHSTNPENFNIIGREDHGLA